MTEAAPHAQQGSDRLVRRDRPEVIRHGLTIERIFTTPGVHPYDEVTWERRDVVMTNWQTGEVIFEQRGVEFPDFWSVNASTIVTTKYFRGAVGTDTREWSLRQLIDRVVITYRKAGEELRLLRHARRTPRSSSTSSPTPCCTRSSASTRRCGSTSARRRRSRSAPASSWPSTTRWTRSSTGTTKRG